MKINITSVNLFNRKAITGLALCFCLTSYTSSLRAQDDTSSGGGETSSGSGSTLKYGAKVGVTYSSFSDAQPHTGGKAGFSAGLFASYGFSDLLGVQIEALYFQQGGAFLRFKDDTRYGAPNDFFTRNVKDSRVTLHNVDVPVLLKINIPTGADFQPVFTIGPAVAFNIAGTERYERTGELQDGVIVTTTGTEDVSNDYELIQIGAAAGLGVEIPMGDKFLSVDARYRYGITPAKKSFSYIEYYGVRGDIRTNTIALSVGLGF